MNHDRRRVLKGIFGTITSALIPQSVFAENRVIVSVYNDFKINAVFKAPVKWKKAYSKSIIDLTKIKKEYSKLHTYEKISTIKPDFVWINYLNKLKNFDLELELLSRLTNYNGIRKNINGYKTDLENYSKKEHWSSIGEFFEKDSGDCEDFVIFWYFSLLELGVEEKSLNIILGITKQGEGHAALAIKLNSKFYILDINNAIVFKKEIVTPEEHTKYFIPQYMINGKSLMFELKEK